MNLTALVSAPSAKFTERSVAVKALVLYEDIIASETGRGVASHFAGGNDPEHLEVTAWNAALVDHEFFSSHILAQATAADLIVIVVCGEAGLNSSLKQWVQRQVSQAPHRNRAMAICLEASGSRGTSRVAAFARRLAEHSGLDFFRQPIEMDFERGLECRGETHWIM